MRFVFFASRPDDVYHTYLIHEILKGNVEKFEILLKLYERDVSRVISCRVPAGKITELVNEAFVKTYFSLKTFKGVRPFKHWLIRIAIRTCFDFWRQEYARKEAPFSSLSEDGDKWLNSIPSDISVNNLDEMAASKEAREVLDWVMSLLSADDRMLITLLYFEEKSVAEIAEIMDWSESNVKVHAFRARRKMREKLEAIIERDNS